MVQEVCKADEEPWRWGAWWPAIGSWQQPTERIIKTDPLTTTWEVAKELIIDHSMVIQRLKKIRKVKKIISVWLMSWLKIKKKSSFWSVIFSYSMQQQQTSSWLDYDVQQKVHFIQQLAMTSSVELDWQAAPKHFPIPNLHQKRLCSLSGGLLPVWSTTAYWIPAKSLHLRSMLSKSMRCTKNCNACSWHRSTERG